jgi:hypothetical protein
MLYSEIVCGHRLVHFIQYMPQDISLLIMRKKYFQENLTLYKTFVSVLYIVIGNGLKAELLLYLMSHSPIKEDALSPFIVLDSNVYLLVP